MDLTMKKVVEASYLTAESAAHYRTILRYFYQQHERMRDFIAPEELLEYLREIPQFADFQEDLLHQQLAQLVKWNNLIARQDMTNAKTIEEYKKKRFRYQPTPYTIEIERMLIVLEKKVGDTFQGSLERITKHFQSRIANAKELIQMRNEGTTLHQVLKEVLDYRKWFTFVLSFSRVNEPKRELTNNAFFKFSGGEKAMAMYIPLFTAAFSRYKEARADAPYIISLDEAFAGVDENNIRDMFEVVEQLGFNYIMNSQALWGDYDTISSLSIAELVRNKNADFVTVIPYEWDGKRRSLAVDGFNDQEELVTHEL